MSVPHRPARYSTFYPNPATELLDQVWTSVFIDASYRREVPWLPGHRAAHHRARPGQAWHGYPLWPLHRRDSTGRVRLPAPRVALQRMEEVGWLTSAQRRRLLGVKPIS